MEYIVSENIDIEKGVEVVKKQKELMLEKLRKTETKFFKFDEE